MRKLLMNKVAGLPLLLLLVAYSFTAKAGVIGNGTHNVSPGWNYLGRVTQDVSFVMTGFNAPTCRIIRNSASYSSWSILSVYSSLSTSSDGVAYGFASSASKEIIVVFRGGQVTGQNLDNNCNVTNLSPGTWDDSGRYSVSPSMGEWNNAIFGGGIVQTFGNYDYGRYMKDNAVTSGYLDTDIYIYVAPNAVVGQTYLAQPIYYTMSPDNKHSQATRQIIGKLNLKVVQARSCTVSTDNMITFPPVDITGIQNGYALANKTGNFSINCNDNSNTPVTVEFQGPKGRYTDTLALTMTDGSNAPAEIRGFVGPNIPLSKQCNGRLDGYPGVVYFVPNAGLEKQKIAPGNYNYNWVLCSNGGDKAGRASGSAKLILSWE